MKHMKAIAIAAVCAMACALALAGCSGGSGSSAAPSASASMEAYVGYWTNETAEQTASESGSAESSTSSDQSASATSESAEAASASAEAASGEAASASAEEASEVNETYPLVSAMLNLAQDGSAMLVVDGYLYEGTWALENSGAVLNVEYTYPIQMALNGGKLTLTQNDVQIALTKSNEQDVSFTGDVEEGTDYTLEQGGEELEYVEPVVEPMNEIVLADDDKVTIKVTGKGTDYTGDPGFRLSIVNKTDKNIYVDTDEVTKVGDREISAGIGEVVNAGESYDDAFLYFDSEELGGGVELLAAISGQIVIMDDDTEDELAKYPLAL
ncbi:MAG TPA: hypothetical protein DCP91_03530 [Eggerthellaceae bacterium]|nr:hypothetical protein [Eggerthellaceae bacterium]